MVSIGKIAGRKVVAVLSAMEEPLGYAVGNALEIKEAVKTLMGQGPPDLEEVCLSLAAHMVLLGEAADTWSEAWSKVKSIMNNGTGLKKLMAMVEAQGGKAGDLENITELRPANLQVAAKSPASGYVSRLITDELGRIAMMLGAGRESAGDRIDHGVGLVLLKKVGDAVEINEPLAILYANDPYKLEIARDRLRKAYCFGQEKTGGSRLILGIVDENGLRKT
jgi:pyrimidine-nucleoside phosphorylase